MKSFVIVIPKEGLAGTSSLKIMFGMTSTIKYTQNAKLSKTIEYNSIVNVILKVGLAGLLIAEPSFGMTTTKMLRPDFVWHFSNG